MPAVRNLISDLAMDVLLYQSEYCEHIAVIVQQECNRILELFKKRNPSFRGSVSLCGHSLGSAILFDILCHQQDESKPFGRINTGAQRGTVPYPRRDYPLDFECEEFFCLGSPIALFQMLKGRTIAGRNTMNTTKSSGRPINTEDNHGTFGSSASPSMHSTGGGSGERCSISSSPKCRQLYNIFHPSDPVSYRIEPLISPAMSSLKPQPLPSVKKSLWAASGQSLSIIGTRVGQSVGSMWSNFTSGVASSLLNRSLGLNSEEIPSNAGAQSPSSPATDPSRANTDTDSPHEYANRPRTLIEPDLETLYDGFQKARSSRRESSQTSTDDDATCYLDSEERARKLKVEDAKVRALNTNGRVDYSVQE